MLPESSRRTELTVTIDVQPNFPAVAVAVQVKNINCIVAACRFAVTVELSKELAMRCVWGPLRIA